MAFPKIDNDFQNFTGKILVLYIIQCVWDYEYQNAVTNELSLS